MDIRRTFGSNMRRYRLAADLSQEAVAERMGIDRAHVSSMERGQQNVTLLTIWSASQALGVRPAALLEEHEAAESVLNKPTRSGRSDSVRRRKSGKPVKRKAANPD